jgi:hypothetical protein
MAPLPVQLGDRDVILAGILDDAQRIGDLFLRPGQLEYLQY